MAGQQHAILLVQTAAGEESRTFKDYNTVEEAVGGMCKLFEDKLAKDNPGKEHIEYDIDDLFNYIDDLPDLAALVFDEGSARYTPHNKDWCKKVAHSVLVKQANPA